MESGTYGKPGNYGENKLILIIIINVEQYLWNHLK
jgi:hypothetical protein